MTRGPAHLIFITQQADPAHPALAATLAQIRALAARVDELIVLADGVVPEALPANARGLSFRAPSKLERGVSFERALAAALRPRPLAVVAHMSPIYAVLAAPLARPLRVPVLLWFTQQGGGRLLRWGERAATKVLTVDPRSFPLVSRKVVGIGHGIDVSEFRCVEPRGGLRLLALGRYAPVKGYDVVLEALAEVPEAEAVFHGPLLLPGDRANREGLESQARRLDLDGRVTFGDAVARTEVPELFARVDAAVNATRGAAADKVVYEAAAACLPVFASSPVFDELLPSGLRFDTPQALANRLREFAARPPAERRELGASLRRAVEERHSVERWADAVLREAAD